MKLMLYSCVIARNEALLFLVQKYTLKNHGLVSSYTYKMHTAIGKPFFMFNKEHILIPPAERDKLK